MDFEDNVVNNVDVTDADSVSKMLIEHLCGEKYHKELSGDDKKLLSDFLKGVKKNGLSYEQFNELLLLLHQNVVSEDFFKFFFKNNKVTNRITLEQVKRGVTKFWGYAMLRFGNYRFAHKQLIQKNKKELEEKLGRYCEETEKIQKRFEKRPPRMLKFEEIPKSDTWYAGYISKRKFEKESEYIKRLIESTQNPEKKKSLLQELKKTQGGQFKKVYAQHLVLAEKDIEQYQKIQRDINDVEKKALKNTDIYLCCDYMDVYVATSMRHKWEFEETFDFIRNVFEKDKFDDHSPNPLKTLNLRYFDPTQSLCRNRVDKGLIEGLMLKRTSCSIYMAQEGDTMGKDSELAATLAQGKPVIAYVPARDNIEEYSTEIAERPLDFFEKRLLILRAEELFNNKDLIRDLSKDVPKWRKIIEDFMKDFDAYRTEQPFTLMEGAKGDFRKMFPDFDKLCKILAIIENLNFKNRARTLQEIHPLAIQVDLQSGVANGVLVVRNAKDCALLIYKLLTNSLEFRIKHAKLFKLDKSDWDTLFSLMESLSTKLQYEEDKKTLSLKEDLTDEELNKLENLSEHSRCPEKLKKHLKEFRSEGLTMLEEKISCSPYRVVTNDEKLTNSFWNFYFASQIKRR